MKSRILPRIAICLPLLACRPAVAAESSPNIVLMLADDMGYANLGCYGTDKILTPNIDRLAAEGIRFTDAHAPAAVCQPSRYGILSGRDYYRSNYGSFQSGTYFRDHEILLPKVLKDAGYSTVAFGKWHLGFGLTRRGEETDWNAELTPGPNEAGFDYWFGMPNAHNMPPFVFIENHRVYKGDPNDPIQCLTGEQSQARGIKSAGYWGVSIGGKAAHEACDRERLDLTVAERASKWIAQQSQDKPFFLYLPFFAPHTPLLPAKEFQHTSPLGKARSYTNAGRLGDVIQQQDAAVATVMQALKQNGFDNNTIVVFTSDNGNVNLGDCCKAGYRSNGMFLGQKTDAWEGGHRVPFIFRWPGHAPAGTVSDKLMCLLDLFRTFLAAAHIPCPSGAAPDSLDQLPALLDPAGSKPVRNSMVYASGRALRVGNWVYLPSQGPMGQFGTGYMQELGYKNNDFTPNGILKTDAAPAQLYWLGDDPQQAENLYRRYPAIAKALDASLTEIKRTRRSDRPIEQYLPPAELLAR